MKYVLSLLFGLVAGAAAAMALLYFNPLTQRQGEPAARADRSLGYSMSAADTWLATHDRQIDLPVIPVDVPLLWENGIKGTLLGAMPLRDAGGQVVAYGSRITAPSGASELLRAGVLVDDFWLLSFPGEGSIFVHAVNNEWPLLRDTLVDVDLLGRRFTGPAHYGPTVGPAAAGARVQGLSGSFAGTVGNARERVALETYAGSFAGLAGELLLDLDAREPLVDDAAQRIAGDAADRQTLGSATDLQP